MAAFAALVSVSLSACGGSDLPDLSVEAEQGRSIAGQAGCAACHGRNGAGGVGPAWSGLAGSTRTLEDGTTVVADDEYLRRAIADPAVEIVDGYTVNMPVNNLTDEEIELVVTYIKEVS
jgi:cytochrome c oxidase subunit 2